MNKRIVDMVFDDDSAFYKKLSEWYGSSLNDKQQINVLRAEEVDGTLTTVVFILKEQEEIEIARVFSIFGNIEISIDLKTNVKSLGGIKKLIQYGEAWSDKKD